MQEKRKLNPALLAALDHYAKMRYSLEQPSMYLHTDPKGVQSFWTVEQTCGIVLEVLESEELNLLKFQTLRDGLKQHGMDGVYERIMGEKL